jgi:hypothetical protein
MLDFKQLRRHVLDSEKELVKKYTLVERQKKLLKKLLSLEQQLHKPAAKRGRPVDKKSVVHRKKIKMSAQGRANIRKGIIAYHARKREEADRAKTG